MLNCITDFTISDSYSHLYYENIKGEILTKSYYKHSKEGFFINGYFS